MTQTPSKKFYHRIDFWLGLTISVVCIIWVLSQIDFAEFRGYIASAELKYIALAFIICSCSYVTRAYRWNYFFEKKEMSLFTSYKCLIVGFFMNNTLPARMGELVRARAGSLATGQSNTSVLATIASERLADALTISLYFVVLFGYFAKPEYLAGNEKFFYVVYFFAAVAACTIITLRFRHFIYDLLERISQRLNLKFMSYILQRVKAFIVGLEPLFMWRRVLPATILSLAVWGIEMGMYYCVMLAFGMDLGISGIVLTMTVVNFVSLIPSAPGAVGTIEALASAALVSIGVDITQATAMIFTHHVLQIIAVGIPGCYYFFSVMKK